MRWTVTLLAIATLVAGCEPKTPEVAAAPPPPPQRPPLDAMFPELAHYTPRHLPSETCVEEEIVDADQFIKLHTELMVTGLTCESYYPDDHMYDKYALFTQAHQQRIRDAQTLLGRFLGRHLRGSNDRLFDSYRTKVANDEASVVIDVSPGQYCVARHQQFMTAANFTPEELETYVDEAVARYRSRYSVCGEPSTAAAPFSPPDPGRRPDVPAPG